MNDAGFQVCRHGVAHGRGRICSLASEADVGVVLHQNYSCTIPVQEEALPLFTCM